MSMLNSPSCMLSKDCLYVAGNLAFSPVAAGLVPIAMFLLQLVNLYMAIGVGKARKKYGIAYPSLYAVPGTKADYSPETAAGVSSAEEHDIVTTKEVDVEAAAAPGGSIISDESAYAFNCVQRGHQNFLENVPPILALILVNWFTFPLISGICGILWVLFKIMYFVGYSRGVKARMWGAGSYFPQFALYGLTLCSAIFLMQDKPPY